MYWLAYLGFSLFVSCILVREFKTHRIFIFFFTFLLFTIPAEIEAGTQQFAPAIFTFLFNVVFEQNISLRVLRPPMLLIPIFLFFLWVFLLVKRRLF